MQHYGLHLTRLGPTGWLLYWAWLKKNNKKWVFHHLLRCVLTQLKSQFNCSHLHIRRVCCQNKLETVICSRLSTVTCLNRQVTIHAPLDCRINQPVIVFSQIQPTETHKYSLWTPVWLQINIIKSEKQNWFESSMGDGNPGVILQEVDHELHWRKQGNMTISIPTMPLPTKNTPKKTYSPRLKYVIVRTGLRSLNRHPIQGQTKGGRTWEERRSGAHLDEQHSAKRSDPHLSVCGRDVPATVDPQQRVVRQRQIELDVGRMVDGHVKPPEEARRDRLALLGSDVDLATVDGAAPHPFLCRWKKEKEKKKGRGEHRWNTLVTCWRFIKVDKEFYSRSPGAIHNQPNVL